jgi:transposase InsO family protein
MFLVIVDAYSKYLDVIPMEHATSGTTKNALRHVFSNFGLPEHIVTDNRSQFTSAEFQEFLSDNDIQHTKTAPGHPATNGLAERYVGHFKKKFCISATFFGASAA